MRPREPALAIPYPSRVVVTRVNTVLSGVARLRAEPVFRVSTAWLKRKGTEVLASLARTRTPRDVTTVFLILASLAGQM